MKNCDRTKVKTITVKVCLKLFENFKKRRRFDVYSTSFSVKMNEKKLLEYKCTKQILRE